MKSIKFLGGVMILVGILLSACTPSAIPALPANVGGGKSLSDVTFTGVIESMTGDQWTINGQVVKVDQFVLQDGPYSVGDTVMVEAVVDVDGSVIAQRVEIPSAGDLAVMSTSTADNSSTAPQGPIFDDSSTEAVGSVDAITDTSITVNGHTFSFAVGVEIKSDILLGARVKLHFIVNADGSLSVREVEFVDPTPNGIDNNSNDDNVNDDNSNGDNSNDSNSNDDQSNNNDSNDDHGSNSNGGGNDNG
jgi:hypothetical protein